MFAKDLFVKKLLVTFVTLLGFVFVAGLGNVASASVNETVANVPSTGGGSSQEKYYGNGVYCNEFTCRVDWERTWYCGVNRAGAAYGSAGRTGNIGKC